MLEVRMIGLDGKVVPTVEDTATPKVNVSLSPGTIVLADYCFNDDGPWIKPEQVLREEDVAAVVFSKRGHFESMVVGTRKIFNEQEMRRSMYKLRGSTLTKYPGHKGKEVFMFYMPPHVKRRFQDQQAA